MYAPELVASSKSKRSSKKKKARVEQTFLQKIGPKGIMMGIVFVGGVGFVGYNMVNSSNDPDGGTDEEEITTEDGATMLISGRVFSSDGKDKVSLATLPAAWDAYNKEYCGGGGLKPTLSVGGTDKARGETIVNALDATSKQIITDAIPLGSKWCVVKVGKGEEDMKAYNQAVKDKLGNEEALQFKPGEFKDKKFAVAGAKIAVDFDPYFNKREVTFHGKKVVGFGFKEKATNYGDVAKNVKQVSYEGSDKFIISLQTKAENDFNLYLIKGYKDDWKGAMQAIKNPEEYDGKISLAVPAIKGNFSTEYKDILEGATVKGNDLTVKTQVAFTMDEKGAKVVGGTAVAVSRSIAEPARDYILDKSFMVLLMDKKAKKHYAATLQINDTKSMTKVS